MVAGLVLVRTNVPLAHAASTIVVNSTADSIANDGVCTLREAIIAANTDTASGAAAGECIAGSGADTINFAITGSASYTLTDRNSVVKNGYTIAPTSILPVITSEVTINGYSQPGALANNAVAPAPLNGTLLIELDGENAGTVQGIRFGGNNIAVKGLVVNRFRGNTGCQGFQVDGDNNHIAGNYIGSDPTGLIGRGNEGVGVQNGPGSGDGLLVGGTDPADRNLIIDNNGGGISPNTGHSNWTIQGNYVGIAADGVTPIGNSFTGGPGGMSIDNGPGHVIGGTAPGAANVVSGNLNSGIAPDDSPGVTIQGNLIGTDYTGTVAVPNQGPGVTISTSDNFVIGGTTAAARNIISGNKGSGIYAGGSVAGVIEGNYIGLDITGLAPIGNDGPVGGFGVMLAETGAVTLGGTTAAARNIISGNNLANVYLLGYGTTSNKVVTGNYIGTNANGDISSSISAAQGGGIRVLAEAVDNMIGGTTPSASNRIAGNRGWGIGVEEITVQAATYTAIPFSNSIIGNEIYSNGVNSGLPSPNGLGIDLFHSTDTSDPLDLIPESYVGLGFNPNTPAGSTPGEANDYINHPVISKVEYAGSTATATFDLNVAGSTTGNYRVEFFANEDSSASGKTYLGFTNVAPGTNLTASSLTIPSGYDMAGKYITATVTELNDPGTNSGFGSTSEFSEPVQAVLGVNTANVSAPKTGLAITGQDAKTPMLFGTFLISAALTTVVARRRYIYRLRR